MSEKIVKRKKEKGKHSSPETSGIQNLPKSQIDNLKGTGGGVVKEILEIYEKGMENSKEYKGLWDEESLARELHDYFIFCSEKDAKPSKASLRLWLGISKSQYWEWETNATDFKSNLIRQANDFMEIQYISKGEQYPTMNMFLLKSSHGHSDKQEIQITGNDVNKNEIADAISKLGLDKE